MTDTPTEVDAVAKAIDDAKDLMFERDAIAFRTGPAKAAIDTLKSLGYLSPEQLAIRDAETARRALELAAGVIDAYSEYDSAMCCDGRECGCQGSSVHQTIQHYIRTLQPAPTGWKLVPEELPAENNKEAVKLALSATVGNWPDYMNSLYRVMIGRVK